MRLRTALNEFKRDGATHYPGEAKTVSGAFSGDGDRLVHVDPAGSLRDYSASLSGLHGLDRSRLGVEAGGESYWFDELDTVRQHYYRGTALVETEYDAGDFTIHQYDATVGRSHLTHVELRGAVPTDPRLVAFLTFAPEGQESRVGRLIHEDAGPDESKTVEVYHRREHDYVTAATGIGEVRGQIPERFEELLAAEPTAFPRDTRQRRYEDAHLSGDVVVTAPLEESGRGYRTTLATLLVDHDEVSRADALATVRDGAERHTDPDSLRATARERSSVSLPESTPRENLVRADLRALDLLDAGTAWIAGPEFDPFYRNSGGYGYAWYRDNARIAGNVLNASETLDVDADAELLRTASFLCEGQLSDGTWPHRAWASDGSLAPGWANAGVEGGESSTRQLDATAHATTFLATLLRRRGDTLPPELADDVRSTLVDAVDAMIDTVADNGLPEVCQGVWEDTEGQFAHTAAVYVEAFVAAARAPLRGRVAETAAAGAQRVFEGLDALWNPELEAYARRLRPDGSVDERLDAATFALVDAYRGYATLEENYLSEDQLDRITEHVGATLNGLSRHSSEAAGLIRYEGDEWRRDGQDGEKLWSVATARGAVGAAKLGALLNGYGRNGEAFLGRATNLYDLLGPDGPFTTGAGYLAEQVFDDGEPDSAAPLGFAHALRMRVTGVLAEQEALPSGAFAPEGPRERPTWTTGEKYGVGTVADHGSADPSRVWFTLTEGALTEVRFPRVDLMNTRTVDFLIVARDGSDYTVRTHNESRRDDDADTVDRQVVPAEDDALLFEHVIRETGDRGHEWTLSVEYAADPDHDAVLADASFSSENDIAYDVYAVADVALSNTGTRDRGMRLGEDGSHHLAARGSTRHGGDLLVDEEESGYTVATALAASGRFEWATVGAAGDETLQEFFAAGERPASRERVDNGNVVLVGKIGDGHEVRESLALGFARYADTAAALGEAAGALSRSYDAVREDYAESWRSFLADKPLPDAVRGEAALANQYRTALMSLLAVEDKTYLGASIASPSVPWGEAVEAEEPKGYGYNFVWSRDLYQVFTVFDLVGDLETATNQLAYIYEHQQDEAGFIPQNTYVNGITRWGGEQMDNISFPGVMAYQLYEQGVTFEDAPYGYENLRRSTDYVARNGPQSAQERWEEEAGYSPSSIAAEIAGLACAGKVAMEEGHRGDALVWLALADSWTNDVESLTATETGTERHDHTPYYVRVTRDGDPEAGHLRTLANAGPTLDERDIIDGGFLELVRLGIKPPDDDVIRNSVHEVDDTIRVDVADGAAFYRYNGDGYGEREREDKGAPWSVEDYGKGRLWPLLTGERGEYELLAHDEDVLLQPETLLETMQGFANSGRMIAEQVWDREYGTAYNWAFAEGTGSATPLAWSMAQYVRLAHAIDAGEPVETPDFVRERYLEREGHRQDRSPALRVDARFEEGEIVVSGETTGAVVAVKTPSKTVYFEPDDGTFERRLPTEYGENVVTVAAASETDIEEAGTTVRRLSL